MTYRNKELEAALKKVEADMEKKGAYLGGCAFSPYGKTDGFDRTVGACACGGGIDTYDGECTCCGSLECNSKKECLKTQRKRLVWDEYILRKYGKKD